MGRLLKSQPIRIKRNFSNDNIPCEILSSFVVGLSSFDVTHKQQATNNIFIIWSGREDLNLRPPAPKAGALPDCATPRHFCCPHTTVYNRSQALTDKVTAPARAGPSRWRWPVMPHTCLAAVRAFAGWLPQLGACSPLPPAPPADRLPSGVPGERR